MGSTELNIFEGKKKSPIGNPSSLHLHQCRLSHQCQLTLVRGFRACSLGDFPFTTQPSTVLTRSSRGKRGKGGDI